MTRYLKVAYTLFIDAYTRESTHMSTTVAHTHTHTHTHT